MNLQWVPWIFFALAGLCAVALVLVVVHTGISWLYFQYRDQGGRAVKWNWLHRILDA